MKIGESEIEEAEGWERRNEGKTGGREGRREDNEVGELENS